MLNDAGYLALIVVMIFWAVLIGLGLLVGFRPNKGKHKPQRKVKDPSIPTRSHG